MAKRPFQRAPVPTALPRPAMRPNAPAMISWPLDLEAATANDPGGSSHIHWTIVAFHRSEDDRLLDTVTVTVEAPTEEQAIARAMMIVQRANYRVSAVQEVCSRDAALRDEGA